jgi:hypothetical protein
MRLVVPRGSLLRLFLHCTRAARGIPRWFARTRSLVTATEIHNISDVIEHSRTLIIITKLRRGNLLSVVQKTHLARNVALVRLMLFVIFTVVKLRVLHLLTRD